MKQKMVDKNTLEMQTLSLRILDQLKTFLRKEKINTTGSGYQYNEDIPNKIVGIIKNSKIKKWTFYFYTEKIEDTGTFYYSVKVYANHKLSKDQIKSNLSYNFIFPIEDGDRVFYNSQVLNEEYRNILSFMKNIQRQNSKYYCRSVYEESFLWSRSKCFSVYMKDKKEFRKGKKR